MKLLSKVLASGILLCAVSTAQSALIYESATLGNTGTRFGYSLISYFRGSRFELTETTRIDSIGGHVAGETQIWGGIISLADATTALPTFGAADLTSNALAQAFLNPDPFSSLVLGDLIDGSVVLDPGAYAIILGGGEFFGDRRRALMPEPDFTGSVDIGSSTYFYLPNYNNSDWIDGGFNRARFEVHGEVVDSTAIPLPMPLALMGLGILGVGIGNAKRKQHHKA